MPAKAGNGDFPLEKKRTRAAAVHVALAFALLFWGCAKGPEASGPEARVRGSLASVERVLETARAEGAEGSLEYGESAALLARAKELLSRGDLEEAEKLLSEARTMAVLALGGARSGNYMERMDEDAQELWKSVLAESAAAGSDTELEVSDVFFEFDSWSISEDGRRILDRNVALMRENSDRIVFVVVEGYCDVRGTEEYNLSLGKKRADEARKYMIGMGVSPSMLNSVGRGETDVWRKGTSEESYAENRRAHLVVISAPDA